MFCFFCGVLLCLKLIEKKKKRKRQTISIQLKYVNKVHNFNNRMRILDDETSTTIDRLDTLLLVNYI